MGTRSRIGVLMALGYFAGLGSCASHDRPSGDVGTVESAVTCGAADLVRPAGGACDGPWEYRLHVHQCTVSSTCTRPRECRHPCFGESPARETRSAGFGESGTCYFYRDGCHGDGPPYCWFFDQQVADPPSIYDQALGWINSQIPDCGPYQYGPVRERVRTSMRFNCGGGCPDMGGGARGSYSMSCGVDFNEFPVWNLARDAGLCGGTEQYSCEVTGYDTQCGPENPPLYSPPQRSLAQVRALVPTGRALYEQAGEPVCLTRDFMPVTTAADVTQKYNKLKETWDKNENPVPAQRYPISEADRQGLRATLAGNFKLLYETKYPDLTDTARTFIRTLYTDHPGLRRECRDDPYQPPATDPARCAAAVAPINSALGMCTELMASHVSDAAFFIPDVCMTVIRDIGRLSPGADGCRQEDYLASYPAVIVPMMKRKVGNIAREPDGTNPPIFTKASLQQQLALMNRLYWHIRQGVYGDSLPDPWVWQAFGEIWSGLWKTVTSRSLDVAGPPYTPDSTQKAIDIGLQTDVRVLEALLDDYHDAEPIGDRPPLKGALFLTAFRDATRAMYERLRELGPYVEVACAYITPSCVEAGRSGPVTPADAADGGIADRSCAHQRAGGRPPRARRVGGASGDIQEIPGEARPFPRRGRRRLGTALFARPDSRWAVVEFRAASPRVVPSDPGRQHTVEWISRHRPVRPTHQQPVALRRIAARRRECARHGSRPAECASS